MPKFDCKCLNWCSHDLGIVQLTGHHETCPDSPGIMAGARDLLTQLVHGIEHWGKQEDGIPEEVWEAYIQAKAVIGEVVLDCTPES